MKFQNKKEEKLWSELLIEGVKLRDGVMEYPKPYLEKIDKLVEEYRKRCSDNFECRKRENKRQKRGRHEKSER